MAACWLECFITEPLSARTFTLSILFSLHSFSLCCFSPCVLPPSILFPPFFSPSMHYYAFSANHTPHSLPVPTHERSISQTLTNPPSTNPLLSRICSADSTRKTRTPCQLYRMLVKAIEVMSHHVLSYQHKPMKGFLLDDQWPAHSGSSGRAGSPRFMRHCCFQLVGVNLSTTDLNAACGRSPQLAHLIPTFNV